MVDKLRPIIPYPTGRISWGGAFRGTSCQATIGCPSGTRRQTFPQQHLAKAYCEMSRRDDAIVAWHKVPGKAPPQGSRPVGYGVIRAGVGIDWMFRRQSLIARVKCKRQEF